MRTRQPNGKPAWPIVLLAGSEKAGKSYACAVASSSDLVDRTFWVGIGEDAPDEYGAIPGARFEIVEHNGTYRGILTAVREAASEPSDGKPNLLVIDSGTRLWELLSDEAQVMANKRRKNTNPDAEAPISMDLWNRATDRWHDVMDAVRSHQGPSLITARLDVVTVLDDQGKPTKERMTKIKAQKSLPYDAGVVVEMPCRGETYITGARSLRFDVPMSERKSIPNFTVHDLWVKLGLAEAGATAPRQHSNVDAVASANDNAAATALNQRRPHAVETAPVAVDWDAEITRCRNSRDLLIDLLTKAKGLGADQMVITEIIAAGTALKERAS